MGVDVHDAGREDEAAGVHPLARGAEIGADRGDASVLDRDAAGARGSAETVDDEGVVDHEIVHGRQYTPASEVRCMADNDAAFIGAIPQNYDRYLGPMLFQGHAEDIAARVAVRPGVQVLEVACGTGIVTLDACSTACAARAHWWPPT